MKLWLSILFYLIYSCLSAQTNVKWAVPFGSSQSENAVDVAIDDFGFIYTTGTFSDTIDADPGLDFFPLISKGYNDIYVIKLDTYGNMVWAFSLGSDSYDYVTSIATDKEANVYLTGYFVDTIDFDPGTGIHNLIPAFSSDVFNLKVDAYGSFVWANKFSGTSSGSVQSDRIIVDDDGFIYNVGIVAASVVSCDFNPGPANYLLSTGGNDFVYLCKLDTDGNFVWAKQLVGAGFSDLIICESGNLYIGGSFGFTTDFDPGIGTYSLTPIGSLDAFICKLNPLGNFLWACQITGPSPQWLNSLATDTDENIYAAGKFINTTDFDPGTGTYYLTPLSSYDNYLLKLGSSGNFKWARQFGASLIDDNVNSIVLDDLGFLYTTGNFGGTMDADFGAGTYNLASEGLKDIFILKCDTSANFAWAKSFGGVLDDYGIMIGLDKKRNIYTIGNFSGSVFFDPDSLSHLLISKGGTDSFLQKINQDSCADFMVNIDSVLRITCANPGYCSSFANGGMAPYNFQWNTSPITNDSIANFITPGIYTLSVIDSIGCSISRDLLISHFGIISEFDLSCNLVSGPMQPGTNADFIFCNYNDGCIPVSGNSKLILDTNLDFLYSTPMPDFVSGDTLIWLFNNLNFDSANICINVTCFVDSTLLITDSVCFDLIIEPISGDFDTTNNIKTYCFPVVTSYDPNDKQVYPQGVNANHGILNNQKMTYTVRFQNTGTAEAINIYILDSLDSHLDLNTVNVISSSHYMFTEVLPGNVLKFRFPNIYLPDSTSDEPNSHGYVIFEVDQLPNLPHNTLIENTVDIYFDYNEPVRTNTVFNTIDLGSKIIASTNTLCLGDSATLTAVPNVPGLPTNWQWLTSGCSGSLITSGNIITVSPGISTAYYLFDSLNGMCYDTLINVNLVNTSVSTSGTTLTANASPATYQWLDCDAAMASITGETNQDFTATVNGNYAVVVTENGCTDTSACVAVTTVGLHSGNGLFTVDVFPNPVNNAFTIRLSKAVSNATISLQNPAGQLVYSKNHTSVKSDVITTENLSSGIYYLTISTQEFSQRIKLIKL